MKHKKSLPIGVFLANRRRRNVWKRIAVGLACIVVFCTVYALILPAVALEKQEPEGAGTAISALVSEEGYSSPGEAPTGSSAAEENPEEEENLTGDGAVTGEEGPNGEDPAGDFAEEDRTGEEGSTGDSTEEEQTGGGHTTDEEGSAGEEQTGDAMEEDQTGEAEMTEEAQTEEETSTGEEETETESMTEEEEDDALLSSQLGGISLMSLLPGTELATGSFGENDALTWTVTEDDEGIRTLTISGEGDMPDLDKAESQPWRDYYTSIDKIIVEEGVTRIGNYAFKNSGAKEVTIGGDVASIGYQAFGYMKSLEKITVPGNVKRLEAAFMYTSSLKKVILEEGIESIDVDGFIGPAIGSSGNTIDIPSTVTEIKGRSGYTAGYHVAEGNSNYYSDEYGALYKRNTDGTAVLVAYPTHGAAASYTVPDNVTQVTATFRDNVTLTELTIPNTVTENILTQSFRDSNLVKVTFGDSVRLTDTTYAFNGCKYLEEVVLPDTITSFDSNTFAGCASLRSVTVGKKVAGINGSLSGCVGLEEFVYNAQNCTRISTGFDAGLPSYHLIIGKDVDFLPGPKTVSGRAYGGFSEIAAHAQSIEFQGPTWLTAEEGALSTAPVPLSTLAGKLYVDENGIIYQYDESEAAATLVYCPDGLESVTVPKTIQSADGAALTVNRIEKYAFSVNSSLKTVRFEDASAIATVGERAFYGCGNLVEIHDEETNKTATTVSGAEALFEKASIGRRAFEGTGLGQDSIGGGDTGSITEANMDGRKSLSIQKDGASDLNIIVTSGGGTMEWKNCVPEEGEPVEGIGGYHLLTGDTMTVTASTGNEEANPGTRYRIYFEMTEESGSLSIKPGTTYMIDGKYRADCHATEDGNIVYLEFGSDIGGTFSIPVTAVYPNMSSSGGGLRVWGFVYDEENGLEADRVVTPESDAETIQAYWSTRRDDFELAKTNPANGDKATLTGDGNRGAKLAANLVWYITLERREPFSSYGKDFVSLVEYTDTLTFPTGISWKTEVMETVRSGNVRRSGNILYAGDIPVCEIKKTNGQDNIVLNNVRASLNDADQLVISWNVRKTVSGAEMPDNRITATVYADAVYVDLDAFNSAEDNHVVDNRADVTLHYNFSDTVQTTASVQKTLQTNDANIKLKKESTKLTYFGEDVTYSLRLYNDGTGEYPSPVSGSKVERIRLEDTLSPYTYIKAENIDRMLREAVYKDLTVTITNAVLAQQKPVTDVTGTEGGSRQTSANSDLPPTVSNATVKVALAQNTAQGEPEDVVVTVSAEGQEDKSYTAPDAMTALQQAGYAVNRDDQYTVSWELPEGAEGFRLMGGEERMFYVYATAKDTFQMLVKDEPEEYPSENLLTLKNIAAVIEAQRGENGALQEKSIATSPATSFVKREVHLDKHVKRNGIAQPYSFSAQDDDLLEYEIDFRHYGSGVYKDMPLVDDMYGVQYLLVPAEKNVGLSEKNLEVYEDEDGTRYYKLSEGSYENVVVGVDDEGAEYTAESITVTEAAEETESELEGYSYAGLHTQIKWYYAELSDTGSYMKTVKYQALVDTSLVNGVSYGIGNIVWMNDRKGSRLYDSLWGGGTIVDFDKDIVITRGKTPKDDIVAEDKYSLVGEGEKVTYRLKFFNKGNMSYTLAGSVLADALPQNGGQFKWSTGNVEIEVAADEGVTVSGIEENWVIGDQWNGAAVTDDQQYILWPKDEEENETAVITFSGAQTAYIYVTLTFPKDEENGAAVWSEYCDEIAGGMLTNTLYVYRYPANVTHNLREEGKVLLQKGVYGTYYYDFSSSDTKTFHETSSRIYYNNRDYLERAIAYYTVLYNGGNKRLYLDDLYDVLPKGFTYRTLVADASRLGTQSVTYTSTIMTATSGSNMLVQNDMSDVRYRSAKVTAAMDSDTGRLRFHISDSGNADSVSYDEEQRLYYLNKGEAIVFGYLCDIDESVETENYARNTIGMAYYDWQGSGASAVAKDAASFSGTVTATYSETNDGSCKVKNYTDASEDGMPVTEPGQAWLLSDVTVSRGGIVPGVIKFTDSFTDDAGETRPYTSSVLPTYTVNWRASLFNSGSYSITNYTFTDIMPEPYVFEGDVKLVFYDWYNNKTELKLFTIGKRSEADQTVTVNADGKVSELTFGTEITMAVKYATIPFKLKFHKDESGNEVMTLTLENRYLSIPESGHVDVVYSSRNPTNDYKNQSYVNQAILTPNVQEYDRASQGSIILDENGQSVGVHNYSPVTVAYGYSTSSDKKVEELGLAEGNTNAATATDMQNNQIVLKGTNSTFRYTLQVTNNADVAMSKLVFIDNLPEPGDGSAFNADVERGSSFKVKLADDPNFRVKIIDEDTAGNPVGNILPENGYQVTFSDKTRFEEEDWEQGTDWEEISSDQTRSFRLSIEDNDPSVTLLPPGATVEVSFDARIDGDTEPGEIAWNSFGYQYGVTHEAGSTTELSALSLRVGVKVPEIPTLQKNLQTEDGRPVTVGKDTDFSFIVYEGEKLPGDFESEADLLGALKTNRRKYQKFKVTVPEGESISEKLKLLPGRDVFGKDVGFVEGQTYTIVELPDHGQYSQDTWCNAKQNYWTFTYDPAVAVTLTCVNLGTAHELPAAGGTGTLLYTISGIAVMAGALMYDIKQRRKRAA